MKQVKNKEIYECCIKCGEPIKDRCMTTTEDLNGDGWFVYGCDNPECERYGLLTTVFK